MDRIKHQSGAIEYVPGKKEKDSKEKYKTVKKAADLTDTQVKELVYKLAKLNKII